MVTLWLDEEWTPLPEHAALGRAVCESVERLSSAAEGPLDASGLVIDLAGAPGRLRLPRRHLCERVRRRQQGRGAAHAARGARGVLRA